MQVAKFKDLPVYMDQALNERHYGALQGLNKAETGKKSGTTRLRSGAAATTFRRQGRTGFTESLKDTAARTIPYYDTHIVPYLKQGKNVIVAAHGNSLRSIVMHLENLTKEQVLELNLDTGIPRVYELDKNLKIVSSKDLK